MGLARDVAGMSDEDASSDSDEADMFFGDARTPHLLGPQASLVNLLLGSEETPRTCCVAAGTLAALAVVALCSWNIFDHRHVLHSSMTLQQGPPPARPLPDWQQQLDPTGAPPAKMPRPLGLPPKQGFPESPPAPWAPPGDIEDIVCDYTETFTCPASELFRDKNLYQVMTDNLVRSDKKFIGGTDYKLVEEIVIMAVQNVSIELEIRDPDFTSQIRTIGMPEASRDAVLEVMRLISAPDVQKIGRDVARVIHNSPSAERPYLRWFIEDSLSRRLEELKILSEQLVPEPVAKLWRDKRYEWDITLDSRNVYVMRNKDLASEPDLGAVNTDIKFYAIYAGALEECRVLLDLLKMVVHEVRAEWKISLHDMIDLMFQSISVPADSSDVGFVDGMLWPLKCGAQGIDTLKASHSPDWGKSQPIEPEPWHSRT